MPTTSRSLFINPSYFLWVVDFLGASDGASFCIFLQHFEKKILIFKIICYDLSSSLTVSN